MAISSSFTGSISLTDPNTGTVTLFKSLAASFSGTISTFAESQLIGTSPVTLTLPVSPTQIVYIKNLHATQTLTVTWTPNGGSSNVVITLQPLSFILLNESNVTSGITALSVTASGASTPIDYVLVG